MAAATAKLRSGAKVWSLYGRNRIRELGKLPSRANWVRASANGKLLAAVSSDWLALWQMPEGKELARTASGHRPINMLAVSPDGKWVATATSGPKQFAPADILLWDATDGHLVKSLRGHKAIVRALAFDPNSRTLVSGGDDATLRVWKLPR